MAVAVHADWDNLPSGNFSPTIFSKKVQKAFRKKSVIDDVTNNDYMGEISAFGDAVEIIKEPDITISALARGTPLATQALADDAFSLVIDKANYFQFAIDDIEKKFSHVNWLDLASDRAAYKMADKYDEEVLGYLAGYTGGAGSWAVNSTVNGTKANSSAGNDELLAAMKLNITHFGGSDLGVQSGPTSIPVAPTGGTGAITSPLAILNRMARLMDQQNVDKDNRWVVIDPVFKEMLNDEDSKLLSNDFAGGQDAGDILRNGRVCVGKIRGFMVYESNNLPYIGSGPGVALSTGSETNYGVIVAGHKSAIATAQQLTKTERFRSQTGFQDVVRGMQLYGRKILRPEALSIAIYNLA